MLKFSKHVQRTLNYTKHTNNSQIASFKFNLNSRKNGILSLKFSTKSQNELTLPQRIVQSSPAPIRPYLELLRVDKPIGTYLLMYPCLWSLAMAEKTILPDPYLATMFILGAFIMRGAGCIVNDLWDRKIDIKVERTKMRPIASGQISVAKAISFLGFNLLCGLMILLQLNTYSILLGAASLSLVVTYPLMKRITYWPQFVLGLAFNWGALIGYSASMGYCYWPVVIPLYIAGICWTLTYDTIYAHQDKVDDVTAGVKSTALLFGEKTKFYLTTFSILFGVFLCASGYLNGYMMNQWPYYLSVFGTVGHLLYMVNTADYSNPRECMKRFVACKWGGLFILIGILLANYTLQQKNIPKKEKKRETIKEKLQSITKMLYIKLF